MIDNQVTFWLGVILAFLLIVHILMTIFLYVMSNIMDTMQRENTYKWTRHGYGVEVLEKSQYAIEFVRVASQDQRNGCVAYFHISFWHWRFIKNIMYRYPASRFYNRPERRYGIHFICSVRSLISVQWGEKRHILRLPWVKEK